MALDHDVKLLAFGTLCGGFLSDRWVGAEEPDDIADWSRMKYKRFIDAGGGWAPFQGLMETLSEIAKKTRCLGRQCGDTLGCWIIALSHR